jgi:hypothetical protein
MTCQVAGKFIGTVCSPLRLAKLDPPDLVLFCYTPMQIHPVPEWPAMEKLQAIRHFNYGRERIFQHSGQGAAH